MTPPGRLKLRGNHRAPPNPPPDIEISMRAHDKKSLGASIASVLAQVPSGNNVTISVSDGTKLQVTLGTTYVLGTNVSSAPNPASAYTGVESTYFTANGYPASPALVTAYAGGQVKVPYRQQFDDRLVVLVKAWAIGGVASVESNCEGALLSVTESANYVELDPDGNEVWHHDVFVFEFLASSFTAQTWSAVAAGAPGDATRGFRLMFTITPTDLYDASTNPTGIQPRVIGGDASTAVYLRYVFFPVVELHDYLVTVNQGQAIAENAANPKWITGTAAANFHDISDAIAYAGGFVRQGLTRNVTMLRPQILVQTSGTYEYTTVSLTGGPGQLGRGYCTIQCDTGVTIECGRTAWDSTALVWRPGFQGCRWLGPGITFNVTNWYEFRQGTSDLAHWLDGVTFTCDTDLHVYVDTGGNVRGYNSQVPSCQFNTNCRLVHAASVNQEKISHHNTRVGLNADAGGIMLVQSEEVIYGISSEPFNLSKDAFTLTASAAGWSVQKTGNNGSSSATMLFIKDAVTIATIQLGYKLVSTFVTEVNDNASLSEITAALLNVTPNDGLTDRGMPYVSNTTSVAGSFTQALTSGVARSFYTWPDVHIDGWQPTVVGIPNLYWGYQRFFDATMQDALFGFGPLGCRLENIAIDSNSDSENQYTQWPNGSTPVITNNDQLLGFSVTGGRIVLGNTNVATERDSYCKMVSHVWLAFSRSTGAQLFANTEFPIVTSCHFGTVANLDTAFMTSVNCTNGSTQNLMFPNRSIQNLIADSAIVGLNQVGDELPTFDANGVQRGSADVKGACVPGLANATALTVAEAAELAFVTVSGEVGDALAQMTMSWMSGAGESGSVIQTNVIANVVAR